MTDTKKTEAAWPTTKVAWAPTDAVAGASTTDAAARATTITKAAAKAQTVMVDRSKDYGDAAINWSSQTKIIQAMVEQAIQQKLPVDLPPQFAAWVMVTVKGLRDVYKSKEDNYLDARNYIQIAEHTKK